MTKTRLTQGITILFIIGILTVLVINLKNQGEVVKVGDEAYDFELEDREGNSHQLSDYTGKPVVLNFFSTWCESCHEQAPSLVDFEKKYADDFHIFTVVRAESKRTLEHYIERHGPKYSERFFIFDHDTEMSDRYGIIGQPETIIIDPDGIVVDHFVGPISGNDLAKIMNDFITS